MELDEVMRTTFAAREFTDDPVPDDVLARIFDVARFAPSGGNRQGAHVVVVRDPDTKERIAELSKPAARRYLAQRGAGESPWNPVHPPGVSRRQIDEVDGVDDFVAPVAKAPVLLVITVDLSVVAAVDQDLDRVGVVSGASVYPLIWNILLAARAEGYGGTFTTMAVLEENGIRELLAIPDTHALAAVVPLGRPVKQLTRLRRRPVSEFVTIERFDGPSLGNL
ncbi:nitroreductase family protein [Gordonia sp. ABSL1-1]|uniref:nitroreductase family protein n=1 Tax=Gordonia sp. ABSL1-1 TaxID=3053923 RepID=UPI00257324F1|nr:nitroreductase family protein [Gordonia sp. ABSL1-1]MDL9938369.1 nitroreductase family protein [Gordonia sp. ABSL1-1]